MFESIFETVATDANFTPLNMVLSLGVAILMGLLVSVVYMKTHKHGTPTQSFTLTLVVLPAIITIIILLVGNSVARAFSLAGAFSIIRFRSAPGDPKDITYVLFTMAIGLACGMGYLPYAVMVALILCLVMVVLYFLRFGQVKTGQRLLKITVPEDLDYNGAFDEILQQYTRSYQRTQVKTTNLGSLYELHYRLNTRDDMDEKAMIDELRCRNGNLN
ncbi:MAG: DUF4956 domain-containing protein, partial [Lachnospiraceae bacterium]|nr:DUF4956 domain-containing protein [Lachnospiraceae bacterium]